MSSSLSLAGISNEELLLLTPKLKGEENQIIAEVVLHLSEIDKRGIYRDAGHSSLFTYCTKGLGYSEGAAARRVQAARKLRAAPELYELIRTGAISLSALAEVSPVMTEENAAEVLSLVLGASKREAEKIAVRFGAVEKPKKERIRIKRVAVGKPSSAKQPMGDLFTMSDGAPLAERSSVAELGTPEAEIPEVKTELRYSYSFEANEEFQAVLERAQAITGVSGVAEVIQKALRLLVETRRPKAKRTRKLRPKAQVEVAVSVADTAPNTAITTTAATAAAATTAPATTPTAGAATTDSPPLTVATSKPQKTEKLYGPLSQSVRRQVFERDCECCTYVSEDGVRCGEQRYLQVDHILPVARGGSNELENLRLLCSAHNLLLAEQWMGREFIERKRNERRASSTAVPA